jgi:hypothetical protein
MRDGAVRLAPGFAPRLAVERLAPFVVEQHVAAARTTAPAG